nr:concanavalin A-like lectin/glucanases superfamily [uncultured bacterium]
MDERAERGTGNLINYGWYIESRRADSKGYGIYQMLNDPEQNGGLHLRRSSFFSAFLPRFPWLDRFQFDARKNLMELVTFQADKSGNNSVLRGQWHHLAAIYKQLD